MTEKNIGVIVQARMGSSRLPGKILMDLDENERVLDVLIKRLKLSKRVNKIIIATTPDKRNSVIIEATKLHDVSYFIGSEKNVLERYYLAAKKYNLDLIIRATSDCPFIDPFILDDMINFFLSHDYHCIRNVDNTTNFSRGFEVEIFSFEVLEKIYKNASTELEKEHVTHSIYIHPELFQFYSYNLENLKNFRNLRLTIDVDEDLELCREVYKFLKESGKGIDFSVFDVYEIIEKNPELMEINKNVIHKSIHESNIKR